MFKSNFEGMLSTPDAGAAMYEVDVSKFLGTEYIAMFNDMARFIIIQIAIQLMLYTMSPDRFGFFTSDFLMLLLFIIIGVMLYHLVFKRLVRFK